MADNKPEAEERKTGEEGGKRVPALFLIAPLTIAATAIVIVVAATFFQPKPAPPPKAQPAPSTAPTIPAASAPAKTEPVVAAPPPPLFRHDLIDAAREAASDFASSGKQQEGSDALVGRRFVLRVAFGCGGLSDQSVTGQLSAVYDAQKGTVTLTAAPSVWTTLPLIQDLPDLSSIEAVEGFWIPRPWMYDETCPARTDGPPPVTPTPPQAPTLGLAQIFPAGGSRLVQHAANPYQYTRKISADETDILSHSYYLQLEGTLSGFADGRALHCWSEAADHAPICLYAATLDRVAFTDADSGEVLAIWTD